MGSKAKQTNTLDAFLKQPLTVTGSFLWFATDWISAKKELAKETAKEIAKETTTQKKKDTAPVTAPITAPVKQDLLDSDDEILSFTERLAKRAPSTFGQLFC